MSTTLFVYYFTCSNSAFILAKVIYGSSKSTVVCLMAQQETEVMEKEVLLLVPSPPPLLLFLLLQSLSVSRSWRRDQFTSARSWSEEPHDSSRASPFPRENFFIFIYLFHLHFSESLKRWDSLMRVFDAILQCGEVSLRNFVLGSFYAQESPALQKISACPWWIITSFFSQLCVFLKHFLSHTHTKRCFPTRCSSASWPSPVFWRSPEAPRPRPASPSASPCAGPCRGTWPRCPTTFITARRPTPCSPSSSLKGSWAPSAARTCCSSYAPCTRPYAPSISSTTPSSPASPCASGPSAAASRSWRSTTIRGRRVWPARSCPCTTEESASHLRP